MKPTWKTCIRIAVCAFALFLCIYYWGAVSGLLAALLGAATPIVVGLCIAYVLNILMSFYERYYAPKSESRIVCKTRRPVCLTMAIITLLAIVALVVWLVIPELWSCVSLLVAEVPPLVRRLLASDLVGRIMPEDAVAYLMTLDWQSLISKAVQVVASGVTTVADVLFTAISSVISVLITIFISVIFSIYLLSGRDRLQRQSRRLIRAYLPKWEERLLYVLSVLNQSFHKFIVGQCLEAVILGCLCILGMLIFRFPYAPMVGTLIGFTALIPIVGAYIGTAVGAVMILTVSPVKALLFIVFILVLQQLEGNLIYPKVVGKSIGLPALWVLAAITIGGGLFGILGMLAGVPIFSAAYRLLSEDLQRRETANPPPERPDP